MPTRREHHNDNLCKTVRDPDKALETPDLSALHEMRTVKHRRRVERYHRLMRSLVGLAILVGATPVAAEPCPVFGLEPVVHTPMNATLASDGGFVVGTRSRPGKDVGTGEIAVQADWKVRARGATAKPLVDVLAPGLAIYRLPAKATEATLEDGVGKVVGKAKIVPGAPTTMAAPRIKTIVAGRTGGKHPTTFVTAMLDGAPPADALALVVTDTAGVARAWGAAIAGVDRVAVIDNHQGCGTFPNGTQLSNPGDTLVAYVSVRWTAPA
jgi:hypothetical protein